MLDIIRKKASSWVTRAIFAVVVLVFIFFFGYNQIITPNQGPQAVLVRVNGADIHQNEFNLAYKSSQEMYKQMFKGELPEGMGKMIVNSALQQLVNQRLVIDAAQKMGLSVSNDELARAIESDKRFQKDGVFDRAAYRDYFLPAFQREFSLNYEDLLRNELLAKKLDEILRGSVKLSPAEAKLAYWSDKMEKKETPTDADWKKDEAPFTKDELARKQARASQEWLQSLLRKAEIEQLLTPNEG